MTSAQSLISKPFFRIFTLLTTLVLLLASFGFFAINTGATSYYIPRTTPIDDYSIFQYCKTKALEINPLATNIKLYKVISDSGVTYQCEYDATNPGGYGGVTTRKFDLFAGDYCRTEYGVFAIGNNNGSCTYFVEYSNDTLTVIKSGTFKITKLAVDSTTNGALSVNGTQILPGVKSPNFTKPIEIGSFSTGQQIVLSWSGKFRNVPFVSATTDSTRTTISICGQDCWIVTFEGSTDNDLNDLILRLERVS